MPTRSGANWRAVLAGLMLVPVLCVGSFLVWRRASSTQVLPVTRSGHAAAASPRAMPPLPARTSPPPHAQPAPRGQESPNAERAIGLARSPGPHFGDSIVEETKEQWESERHDPARSSLWQAQLSHLFRSYPRALVDVQCRQTLCRLEFDAEQLQVAVSVAQKLGPTAAVLQNDSARVVALIPVANLMSLPER